MERTLKDWQSSGSGGTELKLARGAYYYLQGLEKGDRPLLLQALAEWKSAQASDPWRLDVDFALARLYQDLGDFEAQYGLLAQTLQSADKGWRNLRWVDGQKLPKPSSKLIPQTLRETIAYYFSLKTAEADENALRLSRLSLTFYPNRSTTYRSIATYFSRRGDRPHTLKYLLIAHQKDPRDPSILRAIAGNLARWGKKREAGIYYLQAADLEKKRGKWGKPGEQARLEQTGE